MRKYLQGAEQAFKYIDQYKIESNEGIYWDITNAFQGEWKYYDEISLYAGSSGIIKLLLGLYETTTKDEYLKIAAQAGNYLVYRWSQRRNLKKAFSKYAFTTGYAGVAYILNELYGLTKEKRFKETVTQITNEIIKEQNKKGFWSGQSGIVADSGTVLFLISLVGKYELPGLNSAIRRYGDFLLTQQKHDPVYGNYFIGLDLKYVGGPIGKFNTGFPLGPSGVAYTLLKIYQITDDSRFLRATDGIKEFYEKMTLAEDAILLPHYLPDDNHMCYAGYCGGPVGVSRYFFEYYKITKQKDYLKDFYKAINGLSVLHVPEERSAGFWNTDNYCCGTAGVLQLYIGVFLATKNQNYFQKAKATADILLNRAIKKDGTFKWLQAFERKNPDVLTAALGYYDGTAGIAASLLQFQQLVDQTFKYHRLVDDPYAELQEEGDNFL